MTFLQALILGIIQGISEFLPISSDGHLTLAEYLLGFNSGTLVFNVTLHIGTLLAVLISYHKEFLKLIRWDFIRLVIVSSIPTALIGLGMKKIFDFEHPHMWVVAVFFAVTGLLVAFAHFKLRARNLVSDDVAKDVIYEMNMPKAFAIGIAQGLAVLPGLSRSGSTIATSLLLGVSGGVSAFYSFAISVPAVAGACLLELSDAQVSSHDIPFYVIGTVVSFVVGLGAISVMKYLLTKKSQLIFFSYYLWILSVLMFFI